MDRWLRSETRARLDENIDHQRNPFLSGQVVERLQYPPLVRTRTREVLPVTPHLHGERCHAIPLGRHIEPNVGLYAGIKFCRALQWVR
jgi:hypothetical protein